ncbi:unnamed protein product [Effrenium voratum]|nr:unnamed protein product [Effrenium voratum]
MCKLLLPRPGSGVRLPANSVGSFMQSYLAYDGLDVEDLSLEVPGGTQQLSGCMRPVLVRPQNLRWHLEPDLGDPEKEWDEPAKVRRATSNFSRARAKTTQGSKHLVLDFHLGPGQYATMAMREVMRARASAAPRHIVFESDSEDRRPEQSSPVRAGQVTQLTTSGPRGFGVTNRSTVSQAMLVGSKVYSEGNQGDTVRNWLEEKYNLRDDNTGYKSY